MRDADKSAMAGTKFIPRNLRLTISHVSTSLKIQTMSLLWTRRIIFHYLQKMFFETIL